MSSWNTWPAAPTPPPSNHRLIGVLIVLVTGIIATVAVGAVLLWQRDQQPVATPAATAVPPPPSSSQSATTPPRPVTPSPSPTTAPPSTSSAEPTPASTPSAEPTPTPSAKPTPTPSAKPPRKPTKPSDYLDRNPLYALSIPRSDCDQSPQPMPTNQKQDERYLGNLVDCMVAAYTTPVEQAGFTLTAPKVRIYRDTVQTPCGQGLPGYPVFYCGTNEMIYSSVGSTAEYGKTLRLGGYWIVFHEFAHHVQQRIGVLGAAYTRDEEQMQISRRIELQADCYMGITTNSVRSAKLSKRDRAELVGWRNQVADEIHGQSASQIHWVRRGFDTRDFGRCTTWTATKHLS